MAWSSGRDDGKEKRFVRCGPKVEVIRLDVMVRERIESGMIYRF